MENKALILLMTKFEHKGYTIEVAERKSEMLTPSGEIESNFHTTLKVQIPEERKSRLIFISEPDNPEMILQESIEEFKFLGTYDGIWSKDLGIIECRLDNHDSHDFLWFLHDEPLYSEEVHEVNAREHSSNSDSKILDLILPDKGLRILISKPSTQFRLLEQLQRQGYGRYRGDLSIRIEGAKIETHESAINLLIKISHSILFQYDLHTQICLRLGMRKDSLTPWGKLSHKGEEPSKPHDLLYEYDKEPISLYMYARSAGQMPLLQYLSYYQVLEFYFPIYSNLEAQQKIRNYLKNPLFNANRDADISHIIQLVKVIGKGKTLGDERSQIKATILSIIDQDSLIKFFSESNERRDFFDSHKKNNGLAKQKINFHSLETDVRAEAALRIYEVRCRVVHSKDDENQELLLPYSKELKLLEHDIELIEFMAQKAIIAGSRPFKL